MAQGVEGDLPVPKPCVLKEWREGSLAEVGGVDQAAGRSGEHKVLILVDACSQLFSFAWRARWLLRASIAFWVSLTGGAALIGLRLPKDEATAVVGARQRSMHPDGRAVELNVFPLQPKEPLAPCRCGPPARRGL